MVRFSILIPAYKITFLEECIKSVLAQSYENFELIIVDDASPEALFSIISKFKDNRIRYFRNEKNLGKTNLVANWNRCLELATGEFALCIGDDDRLRPTCLETANDLIQKNPNYDIYHLRKEVIDENGNIIGLQEDRPEHESVYSLLWHLLEGRIQVLAEWIYRTDKLRRIGGFYELPLAWGSDNLTANIAAIEKGVVNCHVPVVQYRASPFSISSSRKTEDTIQKCKAMDLMNIFYQDFLLRDPIEELDQLYCKLIRKQLNKVIELRKKKLVENNIAASLFNVFYWFAKSKEMEISINQLLILFLYALKSKLIANK